MLPNYGSRHRQSLSENRPEMYKELLDSGELDQYIRDRDLEARQMHERIVRQMLEKHPLPDDPKEHNGHIMWVNQVAEEFVNTDLILVPDAEAEEAMEDGYTD